MNRIKAPWSRAVPRWPAVDLGGKDPPTAIFMPMAAIIPKAGPKKASAYHPGFIRQAMHRASQWRRPDWS